MKTIRAVIVDDEEHNRHTLKTLLNNHCPNIKIEGEAENADAAFTLVQKMEPDLLFLDVRMPEKSGFDLLKMFGKINFEVIFVSAFNEYAISAFDYNALSYILKPIDYNKLVIAINKAILKIGISFENNEVIQFINTLDHHSDAINKVVIHHNAKVILVNISDIVSIESKDNLTHISLRTGEHYHSSKDLILFHDMLKAHGKFIRINRKTILNIQHLLSYQKGDVCVLKMNNNSEFEVSRRRKTEILQKIKLI